MPDPKVARRRERVVLTGDVPSPINPPSGCVFHTRCEHATEQCKTDKPVLREIIASSIEVAKLILHPSMPISPVVVELQAQTQSDVARVILGNSITLSPGTVTLDMHKGKLLVHCLTGESARALQEGEADRRTAELGLG